MPGKKPSFRECLNNSLAVCELPGASLEGLRWQVSRSNPGIALINLNHTFYRLVSKENLDLGFSEWILGVHYQQDFMERVTFTDNISPHVINQIKKKALEGRFCVVLYEDLKDPDGEHLPLFTIFKDAEGHVYVLELNKQNVPHDQLFPLLLAYSYAIANKPFVLSKYDSLGDYLKLGAPSIVQRHSTEMVKKHLSKKVVLNRELCTQCFRCVTSCSELKVTPTPDGMRLLGPAEDHCTNCGLCQQRCPYLTPHLKDQLPEGFYPEISLYKGGEAVVISGGIASDLNTWLSDRAQLINEFPFEMRKVYEGDSLATTVDGERPLCRIEQEEAMPVSGDTFGERALLLTKFSPLDGNGLSPETIIIRKKANVAIFLYTEDGAIEEQMAARVQLLGTSIKGVVEQSLRESITESNRTLRRLAELGLYMEGKQLDELVFAGKVDVVLTPYLSAVSQDVQTAFLELTGGVSRVMAPNIIQSFTFTNDPLMNEIRDELLPIFPEYPELMEAESEMARSFLQDIPANSAKIHGRYRTMAIASGHSACPTCAEAQVLAIPVYMSVLMSLARKEIPEVTFTCETGCMSETLNKTQEAAQKVRGGRTVFGGGFAFAEAIALAEELCINYGFLRKGRRYVVSQSGDGGSVIGLPAWLNALRQKAFVIRKRMPNVLHFINVTDTQVYSNTGGECSASSMLGMGTLTTPIGKYILGNQKVQWNLINLAAEFPNILVGLGHSGNRTAMQEFWYLADRLGYSAIRWDITPCPETGKFFGEDPDNLAYAMAHSGMLPEVIFVGRLRKRVAPINPADTEKPWREWSRAYKPITHWLSRDPRYRAMIKRNPETAQWEPINTAARFAINQLERYRDQLNWEIDLENALVREAEEYVDDFFEHLREQWAHYRHNLQQYRYSFLFNRDGEMKPEFRESLRWEMLQMTIGLDTLTEYQIKRDSQIHEGEELLETFFSRVEELEKIAAGFNEKLGDSDISSKARDVIHELSDLSTKLGEGAKRNRKELESVFFHEDGPLDEFPEGDLEESGKWSARSQYATLAEARRAKLYQILDRLIEDRAVAKQAEIGQYVLSKNLQSDFISQGGVFRGLPEARVTEERYALRSLVKNLGHFAIGVASLAGDRGIAINRIFSNFFTQKGVWAGMAWQFGSSKRGTPVLSATFLAHEPIERKDAMLSFPYQIMTVTNYGDLKNRPDIFFDNLHPTGFLIINTRSEAQEIREELVNTYDEQIRTLVKELREISSAMDVSEMLDWVSQKMFSLSPRSLNIDQRRLVQKVAALARCELVTLDMDGIIEEVTGSDKVVSNLVAVSPIFRALQCLGFPFEFEKDKEVLLRGFPGAVLKNRELLNYYLEAIALAFERAHGFPEDVVEAKSTQEEEIQPGLDPGDFYTEMGGTLAGMVLSQIAYDKHPLCYVGFPITPAGNPFYAMAQAYANGHPYIYVDEGNPSEKVAAEKLIGIARTGGMLPVTFTASQGWRLFTEIIPQFVGARLEGLFLIAKRALAAPNLNIEESHTDFMSFRDDGGIMLAPKGVQEYIYALYLSRLLTHFAKLPVILSIGGITDTHKIGLFYVPPDNKVRAWLEKTLRGFDFLEHKFANRQGEIIIHGPSGTAEVYQETQSELEKAHQMMQHVFPYAVNAVEELTGYRFEEVETEYTGEPGECRTMIILQGSLYPNAIAALRQLSDEGWKDLGCMSIRVFNPFPEEKIAKTLENIPTVVVLDRSNSFGSIPPLASRIFNSISRHGTGTEKTLRTMVGGLGGREILVDEMRDIFLFSHLLLQPKTVRGNAEGGKTCCVEDEIDGDAVIQAMIDELAALDLRNYRRHTRVPDHICTLEDEKEQRENIRNRLIQFLKNREYVRFLENYNQVEFIDSKELLRETELRKHLVVRAEIIRSRKALKEGKNGLREIITLLHFSLDRKDWQEAGRCLLDSFQTGGFPRKLISQYQGRLEAVGIELVPEVIVNSLPEGASPTAPVPASRSERDEKEEPGQISISLPWKAEEVELIKEEVACLVRLNGRDELYYNPEDFERALLERLELDTRSSLYDSFKENLEMDPDVIRNAYVECYGGDIHRAITREIMVQDFAPEIKRIFEGDGLEELKLFIKASVSLGREQSNSVSEDEICKELESYMSEEIFPSQPKSAGFYLEYYREMVEPDLIRVMREYLERETAGGGNKYDE